ncbi:MAG TPA: glycosyltransferase family 4 protein [Verrucomicrobiae bacterium]|nr:glycosyltransferase family 4 protein [Verrucomicrobiae bacterium]
MKITHIITRLVVGGAQENTLATINGLRTKPGIEVKLISGPTIGPEGSLENDAAKIPGLLQIVPELVRLVHPLKDFIALRKLEKILREQKPDIVHTHSGKAGILGRLAAKRAGVPVIIHHIHGPSFGNFQGAPANFIFTAAEKHAAKVTDHFFCSADAMTKLYLAAGIGKPEMFTRIFSGFNLEPFLNSTNDLALRKKLGLDENHFVIGKIGRIFKLKGHADLLAAFAKILPQIPHARLLFVGDGALRGEIEKQIRALGLDGKVIFTGLVSPGEVARHVGIMDCLAHLSYREALSRALPQALAAGKPVVAYDFDGSDEICLENETGFLIRTGDIETAARKLLQLANDPALRKKFGERGRQFVKENFSVEKMVDDQYNVYLKLAAERGIRA